MSTLKRNLVWNTLLTISGYVFPLLTFPYVTRVLGAENFGMANFALSVVDYAILFSMLGITAIGARYIPQCNEDKAKRDDVFSHLVTIHILLSVAILLIYTACVFLIPKLSEHKVLYFVGASKIIVNIFLVEWLFQGMQDFRYITLRTLVIRTLYVLCIFVFVRKSDDYDNYFYVTIAQVALNAAINWKYARKYVTFKFSLNGVKEYVFPVFSMGVNRILLSFYVTFNPIFLGSLCGDESVGHFTVATRLYGIFLSFLGAYNGVFVPHLNTLLGKNDLEQFRKMVGLSFEIVSFVAIPIIIVGSCLAPEIIRLLAGAGYERAILPFQIVLWQVLFVGLAQILENQILLSMKKFKEVLACTAICTTLSVLILLMFTRRHAEVASAYAVAIPHFLEAILLYYYAKKAIPMDFPVRRYVVTTLVCLPMAGMCLASKYFWADYRLILAVCLTISAIYYLSMMCFVVKDQFLISQLKRIPLPRMKST
ncbi:MAG: flippase [Prevotella sp.]|nr:flippase [Prevotella sp.]